MAFDYTRTRARVYRVRAEPTRAVSPAGPAAPFDALVGWNGGFLSKVWGNTIYISFT